MYAKGTVGWLLEEMEDLDKTFKVMFCDGEHLEWEVDEIEVYDASRVVKLAHD